MKPFFEAVFNNIIYYLQRKKAWFVTKSVLRMVAGDQEMTIVCPAVTSNLAASASTTVNQFKGE